MDFKVHNRTFKELLVTLGIGLGSKLFKTHEENSESFGEGGSGSK